MRLHQIRQLMRDHVLNAHLRPLNQFRVEEDTLLANLAGTPTLFQARRWVESLFFTRLSDSLDSSLVQSHPSIQIDTTDCLRHGKLDSLLYQGFPWFGSAILPSCGLSR